MPDTKGPAKKQLRTLPPPPKEGRFEMSYDRRWPARPGQPEVCLWADDMDDGPFDYPLTIKVRLPATWNNMTARQGGKSAAARVVEHDGGRFALVQAVPDRGEVAIVESVCSR
jgi:hypothetical protein